ncbi:MAG TPA: acyl-CoA reductase [Telmatospirillum sp.]|nr:acyl-CoA reductase [Telmatospirillum sp.]
MDERIEILLPTPAGPGAWEDRLAALGDVDSPEPFGAEVVAFCRRLSALLRKDEVARRWPEIQAFAFWIRPNAVDRLRRHHLALTPDGAVMAGRGLIFHLPPRNVALLFAYGWILALLAGNRNVVRLPAHRAKQADILLRLIGRALDETPFLRQGQLFLSYGHDDAISAHLSSLCDMRVIWGGDETIRHMRGIALPPRASELAFADRFSMAALNPEAVLALTDDGCADLARSLFNDVFWFDQMACSSPRLFVWVGEAGRSFAAGQKLYAALGAVAVRKGYGIDAGTLSAKLTYCYRAVLDGPVTRLRFFGAPLAVLSLDHFFDFRQNVFGAGTLFELNLPDLAALARYSHPKDQTLIHFGIPADALALFARTLNGRGFDRMVPVGQALAFDMVWDGHDLLGAFSRPVSVISSL